MARKVKDSNIGARVDDELKEEIQEYIDNAEITEGDLIRRAVKHYMRTHPIKEEE